MPKMAHRVWPTAAPWGQYGVEDGMLSIGNFTGQCTGPPWGPLSLAPVLAPAPTEIVWRELQAHLWEAGGCFFSVLSVLVPGSYEQSVTNHLGNQRKISLKSVEVEHLADLKFLKYVLCPFWLIHTFQSMIQLGFSRLL